ncbi:MAG: hypothetical protein KAR64_01715, partial [Thermoplasmatales archaeon]|nr:hypothetical protein [Thermoplasmatales archaeon]
ALRPGQSPPPVKIPTFFITHPSYSILYLLYLLIPYVFDFFLNYQIPLRLRFFKTEIHIS